MATLTPEEWLKMATQFTLFQKGTDVVFLETRASDENGRTWAIYNNGYVLGKDGEWHYEPLPSSRTDEFKELTRYSNADEAYDTWRKHEKKL